MVASIALVMPSITAIEYPAPLITYTLWSSVSTAIDDGVSTPGIIAVTAFVVVSITDTVLSS